MIVVNIQIMKEIEIKFKDKNEIEKIKEERKEKFKKINISIFQKESSKK